MLLLLLEVDEDLDCLAGVASKEGETEALFELDDLFIFVDENGEEDDEEDKEDE